VELSVVLDLKEIGGITFMLPLIIFLDLSNGYHKAGLRRNGDKPCPCFRPSPTEIHQRNVYLFGFYYTF
jgi:hypothetical protein